MRLLDLFCCAGGAAMGYHRAGFDVVGVDIAPQKHYPFEFHQADAIAVLLTLVDGGTWQGYTLKDFDAIHASPPCQEYSEMKHMFSGKEIAAHPMLIEPVLKLLQRSGLPWIVENVAGAKKNLPNAVELCGVSFGLPTLRHRLFLSSELLFVPTHKRHPKGFYNVVGKKVKGHGAFQSEVTYVGRDGRMRTREGCFRKEVGQAALGIDWMTMAEMSQAIPPAYTEYLGNQLVNMLQRVA